MKSAALRVATPAVRERAIAAIWGLASRLGVDVDILELRRASNIMRREVLVLPGCAVRAAAL